MRLNWLPRTNAHPFRAQTLRGEGQAALPVLAVLRQQTVPGGTLSAPSGGDAGVALTTRGPALGTRPIRVAPGSTGSSVTGLSVAQTDRLRRLVPPGGFFRNSSILCRPRHDSLSRSYWLIAYGSSLRHPARQSSTRATERRGTGNCHFVVPTTCDNDSAMRRPVTAHLDGRICLSTPSRHQEMVRWLQSTQ